MNYNPTPLEDGLELRYKEIELRNLPTLRVMLYRNNGAFLAFLPEVSQLAPDRWTATQPSGWPAGVHSTPELGAKALRARRP
jgi:hypothetical protein